MAKAELKEQSVPLPDLTNFQVKYVSAGDMAKVKEKPIKPIHPLAQRVALELLKNPESGARFELNTPVLQQARGQFKSILSKGLKRFAQREKKDVKVRCISLPNELVFYYEPAKHKESKTDQKRSAT
jgi:hypothetical protein